MSIPIGAAIKRAREFRSLSQEQVAERMGCPRPYISKIESGRTSPQIDTFVRLASALDVEPWRLLRWAVRKQQKQSKPSQPGVLGIDQAQPQTAVRERLNVRARRWVSAKNADLLLRSGMSADEAKRKAATLSQNLRGEFSEKVIRAHSLDNPYRSAEATRILVNDMRRFLAIDAVARIEHGKPRKHQEAA